MLIEINSPVLRGMVAPSPCGVPPDRPGQRGAANLRAGQASIRYSIVSIMYVTI